MGNWRVFLVVLAALASAGAAWYLMRDHDRAARGHRSLTTETDIPSDRRKPKEEDTAASAPDQESGGEPAPVRSVTIRGLVVSSGGELPEALVVDVFSEAFPQTRLATLMVGPGGTFGQTVELAHPRVQLVASCSSAAFRSHPKTVETTGSEIHAILQLAKSGGVRIRVVEADGEPIPGGLALVTELPQATFRQTFGVWESAATMTIGDRVVACGPNGELTVPVREGHVVVRVADPERRLFGRPHKIFVPHGSDIDLRDLVVPHRAKSFRLRFRDETGPVAAYVRFDERSYRFGSASEVDEVHHLQAGADGCLTFTVPEEACPIRAAAFAPGHDSIGFELPGNSVEEIELLLRRWPSREIEVQTESGSPLPLEAQWIIEPIDEQSTRARSETQPLRFYHALESDCEVLALERAGRYRAVCRQAGAYRVSCLVSGGVTIGATVEIGVDESEPLVLRVPDGRIVELEIGAVGSVRTFFHWRIAWRKSVDGPGIATEHQARPGERLPPMWVPAACSLVEVTERSGILHAPTRVEIADTSFLRIEVDVPKDAARIRLVPTIGEGEPAMLKEVSVLLSGPEQTPDSALHAYRTGPDGFVSCTVRPGRYRAALYPLTRPVEWIEIEVAPGADKRVIIPIR